MLKEGQKFGEKGRYVLVRQLGRGGFSEVWLADDTWTRIQVAIKIYAPGMGLDEAGIELFTQEFSLVFDLNHTNLLKPTYFDNYERQPYLIMPLCKNGSAFKYLTGKEHITERQCWHMLHDVSAGLAYLHGKKPPVIHQDIKPDNILISDEGLYMITDFGISARVRSTIRNGMAKEQSGGTLAYMAPERFSSQPRPIMASDVWSLGAMMYELICGMPPFGNSGGLMQRKGAEIPRIDEEGYSQELKSIIYRCLSESPGERPWASQIEDITYNYLHNKPWSQDSHKSFVPQPKPEPSYHTDSNTDSRYVYTPKPQSSTKRPSVFEQYYGKVKMFASSDRKNLVKYGIAAVVALLIILGVVLGIGGSGSNSSSEMTQADSIAKVDSIANTYLPVTRDYMKTAGTFMETNKGNLLNPANGKIEDQYIRVISKYREYKNEIGQYPGIHPSKNIEDELETHRTEAEKQLRVIYDLILNDVKEFRHPDVNDEVNAQIYEERANAIIQYIGE